MHTVYYPAIVYVASHTYLNGRQSHREYAKLNSFSDYESIRGSIPGAYFIIDNMGLDVSDVLNSRIRDSKLWYYRARRWSKLQKHFKFRQGPVPWTSTRSWSGNRRYRMSGLDDFRQLHAAREEVMEETGIRLKSRAGVEKIDWDRYNLKGEVKNWKKFRKTQYR